MIKLKDLLLESRKHISTKQAMILSKMSAKNLTNKNNVQKLAKRFKVDYDTLKQHIETEYGYLRVTEELTDADIKVGDAYHVKSHIGYMVNFVYEKERRGGAIMIEYQFKPQYGDPGFMSVGTGPAESIDSWGKNKKIKVTSKMKKMMINMKNHSKSLEI